MAISRRRRYLYAHIGHMAREAGLDKQDRLDLAKELFEGVEHIESYSDLNDAELEDIRFMLMGWRVVQKLRLANGSLAAESDVIQSRLKETATETAARQTADDSWN